MRRISFPLLSLGSDAERMPNATDIASWISGIKGNEADIISYETTALLVKQIPYVAFPTAGGYYYTPRIYEALGVKNGILSAAPEIYIDMILNDINLAKKQVKHFSISLVSPMSIAVSVADSHDADELQDTLCDAYLHLTREIRDAGVSSTILLSENPSEIELETLRGNKYLWSVPAAKLESVLEISRDVVLSADSLSHLSELVDSFTIRHVYLKDADSTALTTALEIIDRENIFTAGYLTSDADKYYWKKLSEVKVSYQDC